MGLLPGSAPGGCGLIVWGTITFILAMFVSYDSGSRHLEAELMVVDPEMLEASFVPGETHLKLSHATDMDGQNSAVPNAEAQASTLLQFQHAMSP